VPLPVLYGLGTGASFVAYCLVRWRTVPAATNLRNAFPEKTDAKRSAILKQSYRNLGDVLAEVFHGYGASPDDMLRRMRIENPEVLTRCTSRGRSVALLAAHFCDREWLLPGAGAALGLPIEAMYKPQRAGFFGRFLREQRARFGGKPPRA